MKHKLAGVLPFLPYLFIILVSFIMTFIINAADFDMWARLAVGSIFFQTGHVLKRDIFSYADVKNFWIDHEWGTGAVFYFLANNFGDIGLYLLKFVLILATFILVYKIIKLQNDTILFDPMMIILLGFATFPSLIATVRSQLFTYMFFCLWIYLLEKTRKSDNKFLWLFPSSMLFWVNLHGGFLAGIGLVIIYLLSDFILKKPVNNYLKILAISLPVTLINPYGIEFFKYIFQAALMNRPNIFEWQHFNILGPIITVYGVHVHLFFGFEIIFVLSVLALLYAFKNKTMPELHKIMLLLITLFLGLKHQRHLVFFVLTAFALFYPLYIEYFKFVVDNLLNKFGKKFLISFNSVKNILAILIIASSLISPVLYTGKIYAVPYLYPVGAAQFILQNDLKGNVFVPYRWGSYFLWKLYPQCKVSVDGRYEEVYPDYVFDMAYKLSGDADKDWNLYRDINKRAEYWQEFIERYQTDIIILPKTPQNQEKIKLLKGWNVVYEDNLSFLLLPNSYKNKLFVLPDNSNPVYWHEDLSKNVKL